MLVLDNDPTIRELLDTVLRKLGFGKIFTAYDGFDGVGLLRKHPIDLIITDWELRPASHNRMEIPENKVIVSEWGEFPPYNGAGFVKCLRHSKFSPNPFVPVIMFTGPTTPNHIKYARDAGVNEILLKPIEAKALCNRIIEVVEKPRNFVTSENYKGPCRRRRQMPLNGSPDRRKQDVRVLSYYEQQKAVASDV